MRILATAVCAVFLSAVPGWAGSGTARAGTSSRATTPIRAANVGKGASTAIPSLPSSSVAPVISTYRDPNLTRKLTRKAEQKGLIFPTFEPKVAPKAAVEPVSPKKVLPVPAGLRGPSKHKDPLQAARVAAVTAEFTRVSVARQTVARLAAAKKPTTQLGFVRQVVEESTSEPPPDSFDPEDLGRLVEGVFLAGDIMVFEVTMGGRKTRHVGIYAGEDRFAFGGSKGVQIRNFTPSWRKRLVSVRRVR